MLHRRSPSPPRSLPLSLPLTLAAPLALAAPLTLAAPLALSGLSGCATSSPAVSPQEPEAPRAGAPVTRGTIMAPGADEEVAQKVAELRAAEAQLETALALGPGGRDSDGIPDSADAPSPSVTPKVPAPAQKKNAPAKTEASRRSAESAPMGKAEGQEPVDPCGSACAALASMSRAAEHLCGLAGDGDARCEDARTRVRSAEGRVRAACPACAAR